MDDQSKTQDRHVGLQRGPVKITIDPNDPLLEQLRPGMAVEPTIDPQADIETRHCDGKRRNYDDQPFQ